MLDILRKHSRSFLIYLVFTILIIVFAFTFGAISPDQACGGRGGPGSTAVVAEVDGREVGMQDVAVADALSYSPPSPRNNSQNAGAYMQRYQATRLGQLGLTGPYSGARFGRDPREIGPIKFQKLVDEGRDEAARLADLPSVLARIRHPRYADLYLVPPTTYPDGTVRLKLGATSDPYRFLDDPAERRAWIVGDDHGARHMGDQRRITGAVGHDHEEGDAGAGAE